MEFKRFIGTIEEFENSKFFNELKNTIFAICETENTEAELYAFNTSFYNKNQILALINEKIETIGGASVSYDEENETIIVDNSGSGSTNPLRPLFLAEGVLYNDTDAIIKRTAPWGTEEKWKKEDDGTYTYWEEDAIVDHLPGHYYLNGIGNITEDNMINIYKEKNRIYLLHLHRSAQLNTKLRTIIPLHNKFSAGSLSASSTSLFAYCSNLEVLIWCGTSLFTDGDGENKDNVPSLIPFGLSGGYIFAGCNKLRYIYPINVTKTTSFVNTFQGCTSLIEARLYRIKANISFSDSPLISKRCILYIIRNANPTTAITITLHPDAYARIINQEDIQAALKEKNGYTDESGNEVAGTLPAGASIKLESA